MLCKSKKKRHPAMPPESGFRLSACRSPHRSGSISPFWGRCAFRPLQCRRKRRVSFHLPQVAIYPSNTPPSLLHSACKQSACCALSMAQKQKPKVAGRWALFLVATRRLTTDSIRREGMYPLDKLHGKDTAFSDSGKRKRAGKFRFVCKLLIYNQIKFSYENK